MQDDDDQVFPTRLPLVLQDKLLQNSKLFIYPGFSHSMMTGNADIRDADLVTLPLEGRDGVLYGRNTVVIRPSSNGNGCSARMAVLHARGLMKVGRRFVGHSIIDSMFERLIAAETTVAWLPGHRAANLRRSWITGTHQ